MTGHPSLLAPPPPLAIPLEEASIATPAADHAAISEDNAETSPQAGLANVSGSPDDQATEQNLASAVADSTKGTKKPYGDFLTQATELAFGPNYKKAGPDFKAYGDTLVGCNILPVFAISDNARAPLNLALNTGQDKAEYMFNLFREGYSALKA